MIKYLKIYLPFLKTGLKKEHKFSKTVEVLFVTLGFIDLITLLNFEV